MSCLICHFSRQALASCLFLGERGKKKKDPSASEAKIPLRTEKWDLETLLFLLGKKKAVSGCLAVRQRHLCRAGGRETPEESWVRPDNFSLPLENKKQLARFLFQFILVAFHSFGNPGGCLFYELS